MSDTPWTIVRGDDPIIATAIHAGHELSDTAKAEMLLPEADRLREEDPFTDVWTRCAKNKVVVARSRFEFDLNRPREKAVYRVPADAWGLDVWKSEPSTEVVDAALAMYDRFYEDIGALCDEVLEQHGRFVVLDIHSYNHRRGSPDGAVDDPSLNPEINLGTESIDRTHWGDVITTFSDALAAVPFDDDALDIRENVRFKGGAMTRWINARYGERGCSIAVEVKKIYMDEWTGVADESSVSNLDQIIQAAAAEVREALRGGG